MSAERTEETVLALQFEVELEHVRYWEERVPPLANTDIPPVGSFEHYLLMVNDFTRRTMPRNTTTETRLAYIHALTTSGDTDASAPESLLFLMPTTELLAQAYDLKYGNGGTSDIDIAISKIFAKNADKSNEFAVVMAAHLSDEDAFWRYVVSKGLSYYKEEIAGSADLAQNIRHRQLKYFIEELLREEHLPFAASEFQSYVETYIIDRIQRDPDRLNPVLFTATDKQNPA